MRLLSMSCLLLVVGCSGSPKSHGGNSGDAGDAGPDSTALDGEAPDANDGVDATPFEAGPPPAGDTCADAVDVNAAATAQADGTLLVTGTNVDARTDLVVCDPFGVGSAIADVVYRYTVTATGGLLWDLRRVTPTQFTVDVRMTCDDATTTLACDECGVACGTEMEVTAGDTLFFVVSGLPTTNSPRGTGTFELSVLERPDPGLGEACVSGGRPCPTGSECQQPVSGSAVCGAPACGDGFLGFTPLECEDGNTVSNDGCSDVCLIDAQGAGGATCLAPATLNLPRIRNVLGGSVVSLAAFQGDFAAGSDLGASCATAAGPEAVYVIDIAVPSSLAVSATNAEALSIRRAGASDCGALTDELGCTAGLPTATLGLTLDSVQPGRYSIILDREEPSAATTTTYTGDVIVTPL
jgi:cysteine-rich repeat protein